MTFRGKKNRNRGKGDEKVIDKNLKIGMAKIMLFMWGETFKSITSITTIKNIRSENGTAQLARTYVSLVKITGRIRLEKFTAALLAA